MTPKIPDHRRISQFELKSGVGVSVHAITDRTEEYGAIWLNLFPIEGKGVLVPMDAKEAHELSKALFSAAVKMDYGLGTKFQQIMEQMNSK